MEYLYENLWLTLSAILWTLVWTGWALWIAARKKQKVWFIVLLILNTLGILEIFYIFFFSKERKKEIKEETR